ncbi:MAG: hypothetical protein ND895_22390 [Pyrinomonadaceae bacterium]|nr:hypothetical protein [Pyrinomonadaceae bacterium]
MNSAERIDDAQWDINLVSVLPDETRQKQIRCNSQKVCWSWDQQAIWIGEEKAGWRKFYVANSQATQDARIANVYLTSADGGWVVADGSLFRISEGGNKSHRVEIAGINRENGDAITSIYFADKDHGWVAGGKFEPLRKSDPLINTEVTREKIRVGCIYETSDGGTTWDPQSLPRLIGGFDKIDFWDNKIGLASNRNNVLFTNDSGKSWADLAKHFPSTNVEGGELERTTFVSGFFLNQNNGWLVFSGMEFEALVTEDGGRYWRKATWRIDSESQDSSSYPPVPGFVFVDDVHGLFVYKHMEGGELFKTSDGGKTWNALIIKGSANVVPLDLFFHKNTGGLLVANKGIYRFSLK